jgi:hypothetical protein
VAVGVALGGVHAPAIGPLDPAVISDLRLRARHASSESASTPHSVPYFERDGSIASIEVNTAFQMEEMKIAMVCQKLVYLLRFPSSEELERRKNQENMKKNSLSFNQVYSIVGRRLRPPPQPNLCSGKKFPGHGNLIGNGLREMVGSLRGVKVIKNRFSRFGSG